MSSDPSLGTIAYGRLGLLDLERFAVMNGHSATRIHSRAHCDRLSLWGKTKTGGAIPTRE